MCYRQERGLCCVRDKEEKVSVVLEIRKGDLFCVRNKKEKVFAVLDIRKRRPLLC